MYKREKTFNESFLLYCALEKKYKIQEQELEKLKKKLFEKTLELNISKKKNLKLENQINENKKLKK